MKIGNKVRLLHSSEEGVVVAFKGNHIVDVEIEDGFVIPVKENELVVISEVEDQFFNKDEDIKPTSQKTAPPTKVPFYEESGLFLALIPVNDHQLQIYFINSTPYTVLYTFHSTEKSKFIGKYMGECTPMQNKKLDFWIFSEFESWPSLFADVLFYNNSSDVLKDPIRSKIQFKSSSFFKNKRKCPIIHKDGYLIKIDETAKKIDPKDLKESMFKSQQQDTVKYDSPTSKQVKQNMEVDLHIEKLVGDYEFLSNKEMLEIQMAEFEKQLNIAIIQGAETIKFIHGVGNGTLRHQIHKKLSQIDSIKFYEDANKERFGYGATLVKIN